MKPADNCIAQLKQVRDQIKKLTEQETLIKSHINSLLDQRGLEELLIGDNKVSRVLSERVILDGKSLKTLYPEIYSQFEKKSIVVTLKVL